MKADKSIVFVKRGNESQTSKVEELIVGGAELGKIITKLQADNAKLNTQNTQLIKLLEKATVLEHDKSYLIQTTVGVKEIKNPIVVEYQTLEFPVHFYDIINGKLVLNKERLSAL